MWLLLSFLTAAFESLKDVACKKGLQNLDEYTLAWGIRAFSLPPLLIYLVLTGIPGLDAGFWPALLVGGTLNVAATVLFLKALKYSDLSLSIPMVTFTPVFLLLTSPLILGEFPGPAGVIGIVLIVLGSYLLNIRTVRGGWSRPIVALFREKGPRTMLLVAFIWSVTSNIDKIGISNSSIVFWIVAVNLYSALVLTPVLRKGGGGLWRKGRWGIMALVGVLASLRSIFQMAALSMALVSYVISIKRTSVVFTILLGFLLFREKGISERLLGALIMLGGVFLILLS